MLETMKAALFDLDGVIVDTAKYHYLAWKRLANSLGFDFTEEDNEKLKGISRAQSLDLILEMGDVEKSPAEKAELMTLKNEWYVDMIAQMPASEALPGAVAYLDHLRDKGIKIALGSASKNAPMILDRLEIADRFDAVIDGNKVTRSKPDPEVFIEGARAVGVDYADCVVFEDSIAGLEAAKRVGMYALGIGEARVLKIADQVVSGLSALLPDELFVEVPSHPSATALPPLA
jgi:beta-phosphoglucomutase